MTIMFNLTTPEYYRKSIEQLLALVPEDAIVYVAEDNWLGIDTSRITTAGPFGGARATFESAWPKLLALGFLNGWVSLEADYLNGGVAA